MNKAFVREPEDLGRAYCPRCGALGDAVGADVLGRFLTPAAAERLGDVAYFCPAARCDVVYFDPFERLAFTTDLAQPVYPKDRDAPLCGCFGLTEDDIEADLREGTVTRVRELVHQAKSPAADCARRAANGKCCIGEVQRYYMQRKGAGG